MFREREKKNDETDNEQRTNRGNGKAARYKMARRVRSNWKQDQKGAAVKGPQSRETL